MMKKLYPKIGIVIPAYNIESHIFRALESCINQSYDNIEILVVDDGSTDRTYDVIREYRNKDYRIKLFHQENGGVSSARNRALDMCNSDYVLFLDADDWLEIDTVEKLIQRIDNDGNIHSLISSACYYVNSEVGKNFHKVVSDIITPNTKMSSEEALMYIGKREYSLRSSCYKLFSMEVINRNNLRFDVNIKHGEDGLFVFEYLKNVDSFIYFTDPLWNIFRRPGSASRSPYNSFKMSAITAVERMLAYDNSKELSCELKIYYVSRTLGVLSEAFITKTIPQNDIKFMRKKLRQQFWIYMKLQKKIKLKLIYILETFFPSVLVAKILNKRRRYLSKKSYLNKGVMS